MRKNENFVIPDVLDNIEHFFTNPLTREKANADPCIIYCENEKCYYGISTGNTFLTLHRCNSLKDMFCRSESKVIYTANPEDDTYGFLWAPELHLIKGKWYIYTSTHQSVEDKDFKHVIVLEAITDSPFDGFKLCGHINRNLLAIDPTIYQDMENDKLYICYSLVKDGHQRLVLQHLKSPCEPVGEMVEIARAQYSWEMVAPYCGNWTINEGAYFIKSPNGRLFIVYSGNGCWSDDYVLGIIEYIGGEFLSASSWKKCDKPLYTKGNDNYGPGHATFFHSPDKTELWICHHCLHESNPKHNPMPRHCHCQKVYFDETGFPHIGLPVAQGVPYPLPSGE